MLKDLQRIENCVYNAFEKLRYNHKCDIDIAIYARNECQQVHVYCNILISHVLPRVECFSFVIKTARVYQDVYAYAYNVLSDILQPYFKQ